MYLVAYRRDTDFPLVEWYRIIAQAIITFNILWSFRANPKMSAYTYLFGEFDFNATPLAPPGTRVVALTKSVVRRTWGPNGEDAWHIVPSLSHYRCVNYYFLDTRVTRDVDTIECLPSTVPFPKVNLSDFLKQTVGDIVHIL